MEHVEVLSPMRGANGRFSKSPSDMNSNIITVQKKKIKNLSNGNDVDPFPKLPSDMNSNTIAFDKVKPKRSADGKYVNENAPELPTDQPGQEPKTYNEDYEKWRNQRLKLLAQKREEKDKYEQTISENRHKRLQHLVKQSQFYVDQILNPKPPAPKTVGKKKKPTTRKRAKNNDSVEENVSSKKKRKLSEGDIANMLSQSDSESDSENKDPNVHEEAPAKLDMIMSKDDLHKIYKPSEYFVGELYDFQKVGVQWLLRLCENGLNGILADEMGLGKTIQVIALFTHLMEQNIQGINLIIAPLSTIGNWKYEFERFAPELKVIIYHGPERHGLWNEMQRSYNLRGMRVKPIILTTYEQVVRDGKQFRKPMFNYIVIDEGQRIKNHDAQLSRIVRDIKAINRLLLTGTPLQNNLSELWALLNFLMPEIFNDLDLFVSWFEVAELQSSEGRAHILKLEEEKKVFKSFREILNPFMLRRMKDQVGLKIPPKKEVTVYCPLTQLQHDLYAVVLKRDIHTLQMIGAPEIDLESTERPKRICRMVKECPEMIQQFKEEATTRIQKETNKWKMYIDADSRNMDYLLNVTPNSRWTNYKKIVNHPYLMHQPLAYGSEPRIDQDTINSSGKLMVMDKMLEKLHAEGHKVLIFSTWVMTLDIIEDYLSLKPKFKYCRLDGACKIENRMESIQSFNTDPEVFLFLITTRAGGVGLNLMAADTVIIYDSDWNPQCDIQAMARCHRVGQTRPVMIYRFCTKGTIDEEIIARGTAKLKLEKAVMDERALSKETLLHLQAILESDKTNVVQMDQAAISEEELDKLLDRSELIKEMEEEEKKSAKKPKKEKE